MLYLVKTIVSPMIINNNNCKKRENNVGTKEAYVWTCIGISFVILFWIIFILYMAYYYVELDNLTIDIVETTPKYHFNI